MDHRLYCGARASNTERRCAFETLLLPVPMEVTLCFNMVPFSKVDTVSLGGPFTGGPPLQKYVFAAALQMWSQIIQAELESLTDNQLLSVSEAQNPDLTAG